MTPADRLAEAVRAAIAKWAVIEPMNYEPCAEIMTFAEELQDALAAYEARVPSDAEKTLLDLADWIEGDECNLGPKAADACRAGANALAALDKPAPTCARCGGEGKIHDTGVGSHHDDGSCRTCPVPCPDCAKPNGGHYESCGNYNVKPKCARCGDTRRWCGPDCREDRCDPCAPCPDCAGGEK
jgi:hypothetical protein